MDQPKEQHKRRVRYKGTHPKAYEEKYKELQPDKYGETIEKVIKKGSTPAGMHLSICVDEILKILQIKPGSIGLDATLGYGGHTLEMLKCLEHKGHIYGLDVDPIEMPKTKERLEKEGYSSDIITFKPLNFSQIDEVVAESGPLDFILADLGVSSMQIDNPERGFSYKVEGPLDLRLNPKQGKSAAERLREVTQYELKGMLIENADEPHAELIANAVMRALKHKKPIETTTALRKIIEEALQVLPKSNREDEIKKSCQRSFQALRIDVNHEFEALYTFLEKLPQALAPGGRVAILSFHSGEDRLVKKSFKRYFNEGLYTEIAPNVIRPTAEECFNNSRAKSAKLRFAIKSSES